MLVRRLEHDYDVASCATAEEAETLSRRFLPDVLLTDVHLPGASGL